MNELSTTRTPEVIASEVMTLTASALVNIIEIGRRFTEAKEILPHGEFGPWLEKLGYKTSTANNFMRLFDAYGSKQNSLFGAEVENFQTFGKLSYSKALALLEVPAEEREEFVESHPIEDMSTRELREAIRERDETKNALKEAEQTIKDYAEENVTLTDDLANAERRVKELESRPVDVAVAEPDPAEIERRAKEIAEADTKAAVEAAEKKAAEEREKLQKKLEKAEAAKKKAENDAANAGSEDKAEAEKLRAEAEAAKGEIERLRKQLAMSDSSVTTFKIHFESWQKAHAAMMEALGAVPAETADKLRAAINAAIKGWEETDND